MERKVSFIMRLLFAEDERSLSKAVTAILKNNNFSVDTVFDGQEALDYLDTENYDGVILDVMMPKVDGFTVLKKMRAAGNKTPVLMLTAKSDIEYRVLGLDSGANDYLTKPFAMQELLARIRAMTRSASTQSDSKMTIGNITLDSVSYELIGPGGNFKLSNKEYQILEMLLKNPRKVISADLFMDRIWGFDSDSELNVVWVYISYLRKKLSSIQSNVQIKAKRGVGYYLEVCE